MVLEKPTDEELRNQILSGGRWLCILGLLLIISMVVAVFNPFYGYAIIIVWCAILHNRQQEMFDKIRLEIRESKRRQ